MFQSETFQDADLVASFELTQIAPKSLRSLNIVNHAKPIFTHEPNTKKRKQCSTVHKKSNIIIHHTPEFEVQLSLCNILRHQGIREEYVRNVCGFLILLIYGKRNLSKAPVTETKLSSHEKYIYQEIQTKLNDPIRKARIESLLHSDITKREIHFFIVHYVLMHQEVAYWLDKRTYPYQIIGEFNEPNQQHILQWIENGAHIVWINLHHQYKVCKNKNRKILHAPYARSVTVAANALQSYSLSEWNFYLWLDDIGGFEAFRYFQDDIRFKKKIYDQTKRMEKHTTERKHLASIRNTVDTNYKAIAF